METLSQQFENFKASNYNNLVEEYLSKKPFVMEIKLIIGDYYKLSLKLDKESVTVFAKLLNVNIHIFNFENINNQPVTTLYVHIPDKNALNLLKEIDVSFQRVVDYVAYKRFKNDSKNGAGKYAVNFWSNLYDKIPEDYLLQQ